MDINILPLPKKLDFKRGTFRFSNEGTILLCGGAFPDNINSARIVSEKVFETKGIKLPINRTVDFPEKKCINLVIEKNHLWESYRLS